MKRARLALGVVAVLSLFSSALTARSTSQSTSMTEASGCASYCREVCIANGDPCCNLGPNLCACC